jgi:Fe-S-cluster containining protein
MARSRRQELRGAFACARCGHCCRVPGYVRLREGEAEALARFLGLSPRAFTARFTRLMRDRTGLSLADRADGACVFLRADETCAVHACKPRQCREFPLGWRYPGLEAICPGARQAARREARAQRAAGGRGVVP